MHDTIQGNSANLGLKSKLGGPPSISELISTYARITGSQHWIQASLQQLSPIYTVFLARSLYIISTSTKTKETISSVLLHLAIDHGGKGKLGVCHLGIRPSIAYLG